MSTDTQPYLAGLSLRANFSWTFIGSVVYAGCQWGMLVVLTKLGSPAMVGKFALGLAVTAPVIMLSNLQLRGIQATDARREYLFRDYLGLRIITTALALMSIVVIALISGYRGETALTIMAVGVAKAFEAVSDVFYGLLQQRERMDRVAKSKMIKGPLSLIALGAGVFLTGRVLWGAAGLAIAWALVLVTYDLSSGLLVIKGSANPLDSDAVENQRGTVVPVPRWEPRTLLRLTRLALPLGFVMMLISLNTNIPRYFIERRLGEHELGIFAATAYLMVAGNIVVSALGNSASPRLAKYYAGGNARAFQTLLLKLMGVSVLLGGGAVLIALVAGREILTLLYRPEYAEYHDVFVTLMMAAGIGYAASFLGYGMTAARRFQAQLPLFVAVTGTTALACLWLIPSQGLLGAAVALVIAAIVQVGSSAFVILDALRAIRG